MKMKHWFSVLCVMCMQPVLSQEKGVKFELSVSKNEVLQGNAVTITYQFEGGNVYKFTPPEWNTNDFWVKSGPNQSSSITIMNGVVNSSITFSYVVVPKKSGELPVPSASVETEQGIVTSNELIIKVLENTHYTPPDEDAPHELKEWSPLNKMDKKEQKKRTIVRV